MNYIYYIPYNFFRQTINGLKFKLSKLRRVLFRNSISIHHTTLAGFNARIETLGGGSIKIGRHCSIHDYAKILTYGGNIEIGDNVSIHPYCLFHGNGGLKIGNDVRIAPHVVMLASNHIFKDKDTPIRLQGVEAKGIVIEDDVWLGVNCIVLDGVTIGRGSVIGAGSVVTKSLPEYSVAVGMPARIIYKRGENP